MNIMKYVPNGVSSKIARQVLVAQKNSPTLLFGAGVVGVVATVVLAARATLNLEDILDEADDKLEIAKRLHTSGRKDYSDRDYKQDVAVIHVRSAVSIAKLYGPAAVIGVASIASLSGSHFILTKRNVGLTAAYAAIQKGFAEYRERVVEELGEDKERELRYGSETHEILEETKKGEPKVKKVKKVGPNGASIYAKFFDDRSTCWSPEPMYNMLFLRGQQNYANDRLQSKGHVLLNDIYDALGLDRTPEGCVVGWVKGHGDNSIDFGVFEGQSMDRFYDFVTGAEGALLLDFNVDGVVYDLI